MLLLDTKGAYETIPKTSREYLDRDFAERYLIMQAHNLDLLKLSNNINRFDNQDFQPYPRSQKPL
jgi:hypothetical protein